MIVYVETNFILEIALLQDEHDSCTKIIGLAEASTITLALPAFSAGEAYVTLERRRRERRGLHERLTNEIKQLSRSQSYQQASRDFLDLMNLLLRSSDEEKLRLDETLERVLATAKLLPLDREVFRAAIELQKTRALSPPDSVIYASIIQHLTQSSGEPACFITKNTKDFH